MDKIIHVNSTQTIDGRALAEKINGQTSQEINKLPRRPNLGIILVGERQDSVLYVERKEIVAKKCGVDTRLYKFDVDTKEPELLKCIDSLNHDDMVDGILLQLPLPAQFDTNKIVASISPNKEVDGFHPSNLAKIHAGKAFRMPVMVAVILEILASINCDLKNKTIALLAYNDVFIQGVRDILKQRGAIILPHQLRSCVKQADVVITAIGKKHYLTADYLKLGVIIIDIGIVREGKKIYGDVDFSSASKIASFITPVPGGVGPITIACALRNVLELYKTHCQL